MKSDPIYLSSADLSCRKIAEHLLFQAAKASNRLISQDPEALHDFRVALRRLRTHLKTYREFLGRSASKKIRRKLKQLAQKSNVSRDAEVEIEWLRRHPRPEEGDAARRWLIRHLREKRAVGELIRTQLQSKFKKIEGKLEKRLRSAANGKRPAFQEIHRRKTKESADRLRRELAAVSSAREIQLVHRARISTKTLRYLLEPVVNERPGTGKEITVLKSWQTLLGHLHDLHVLEAELGRRMAEVADGPPRPLSPSLLRGLVRMEKIIQREERILFRRFEKGRPDFLRLLKREFISRIS